MVDITSLVIEADSRQVRTADRDLAGLTSRAARTESVVKSLGRQFAAAFGSAAVIAGLSAMARGATDFHTALAEVSTLLDDIGEVPKIQQAAKDLTREFGALPVEQTKAFYNIISAGASDAAEAQATLTAANKLAIGGVTTLDNAVDGLTSTLNAYGMEGQRAGEVADAFFVAMRAGKTTVGELSSSIGQVASISAAAKIPLEELLSAVSAITTGGVDTRIAMTNLRQVIVSILKPASEAADLAEELGIEFTAAALQSKGLAKFLDEVKAATGGNLAQMSKLFGSVEALNAVLSLTGPQAEKFAEIIEQMGTKAGQTQTAYEKMAADMGNQTDVLIGRLHVLGIEVGERLLSALLPLATVINNNWDAIMGLSQAVAILVGSRLVAWLLAVSVQMAINIQQSIAYQAALARMAGASLSAAAATGVLRGALALLGGPAGIIFLAIGGLAAWMMRSKDATTETDSLKEAVDRLTMSYGDLAEAELQTTRAAIVERIVRLRGEIDDLAFTIQRLQETNGDTRLIEGLTQRVKALAESYGMWTVELEAVIGKINELGAATKSGAPTSNVIAGPSDEWLRSQEAVADRIAALQLEAATLNMTETQAELYRLSLMGASEAQLALARSALEARDALDAQNTMLDEAKAIYDQTRTPAENLSAEIQHLNELLEAGAFGEGEGAWDTYARAVMAAQDRFDEMTKTVEEDADKMTEFSRQAARNMQTHFADFLFDPFDDGVKGMLAGFADALRRMVAEALAADIFGALGGLSSRGGLLGAVGGFFSGFATGTSFAPGGMALVGERGPELVNLPRGSQVVPNNQLLGTRVEIIDQRGANAPPIDVQQGMDGIRVIVRSELNSALSDGSVDRPMAAFYGVRRIGR